jgi:hypothetical protein
MASTSANGIGGSGGTAAAAAAAVAPPMAEPVVLQMRLCCSCSSSSNGGACGITNETHPGNSANGICDNGGLAVSDTANG